MHRQMIIQATALTLGLATLAGCGEGGHGKAEATPPAPQAPIPPSPDLPLTRAKVAQIIGNLPLICAEMGSLKMDMLTCEERQSRPADHEALRTELRDLRWTLQSLPVEEASARCTAIVNELRSRPSPAVCYDLGY